MSKFIKFLMISFVQSKFIKFLMISFVQSNFIKFLIASFVKLDKLNKKLNWKTLKN